MLFVQKDIAGRITKMLAGAMAELNIGDPGRLSTDVGPVIDDDALRMLEDHAVIEVRDTGMGMPAESLPHIFERFYRVERNNKVASGTGLGLALVHYIVTELHNARIDVESTVSEGTCFSVTIPLGHRDRTRRRAEPALCPA